MTKVWKIVVRRAFDEPDLAQGWAKAATQGEALALANSGDARAFLSDCRWPGPPDEVLFWSNGIEQRL